MQINSIKDAYIEVVEIRLFHLDTLGWIKNISITTLVYYILTREAITARNGTFPKIKNEILDIKKYQASLFLYTKLNLLNI